MEAPDPIPEWFKSADPRSLANELVTLAEGHAEGDPRTEAYPTAAVEMLEACTQLDTDWRQAWEAFHCALEVSRIANRPPPVPARCIENGEQRHGAFTTY